MTLFTYVRLSSEDSDLKNGEKLESNSISNQRNLIDAYIKNQPEFAGAKVMEFCDDGWSGKNFDRPAVREMLEQARQGKAQCIIVKDLSRFGRDYIVVGNYISKVFPFLGIRFIAINDGFDSIRPTDINSLETAFKTLLYDLYSRDLSRKVRSARQFRAKRGEWLAAIAPFGYMRDPDRKGHMVIDPPAAEIVRRIFQMAAEGRTAVEIAQMLNREHTPTPMLYKQSQSGLHRRWNTLHEENFWTDSAVVRTLRDEQYLGKTIYGKRFYDQIGQGHSVKVSKKDWIIVDGTHDSIISQELFDQAQTSLHEFAERKAWANRAVLIKKVRCGICGHAMLRRRAKRSYFICRTSDVSDLFVCPSERIFEDEIMDVLLDGLRTQAAIAVEWSHIWEARHQEKKRDAASLRKKIAVLKETLNRQNQEIKGLHEALVFDEISKDEYIAAKAALVLKRDHIAGEIAAVDAEAKNLGEDGTLDNAFVSGFQKYAGAEEITSEIAEDVLKEVLVYPDGRMKVIWNYREDYEKLMLELYGGELCGRQETGMDLLQDGAS